MQTIVNTPTIDDLVNRLRKSKHYFEYKMTAKGFTRGNGYYYDPSDLVIVNVYTFQNALYPEGQSFVYIIRDKIRTLGFSVDAFTDFNANEANLYHWFISKVPRDIIGE